MAKDNIEPVPLAFDIKDNWAPSPYRPTTAILKAYKALDETGRIHIQYPIHVSKSTGQIIVEYKSEIPANWIHDELRILKQQFIAEGKQMQMRV